MGQYSKVYWRGVYITERQRQALMATERALRDEQYSGFLWDPMQGSWRPQTSYSGTTHTGAGVVDLSYYGMTYGEKYNTVLRYTRRVGRQAAFGRGPNQDMPYHFHVCDLDTKGMDYNAVWQVAEYLRGNDGLVAGRDDPYPYRPDPIRKWRYRR
jgi:hypothetical protein